MIRPYLTRLVSTRVPIVRTFSFTPKIFVGETWSLNHADGEKRARKDERDRLLALKRRLKARQDHMDEMDDHLYDPMRLCLTVWLTGRRIHAITDASSKEEKSRLIECLESLRMMRKAQGELEKHVYGFLDSSCFEHPLTVFLVGTASLKILSRKTKQIRCAL